MSEAQQLATLADEKVGYAKIGMASSGAGGGSLAPQTLGEVVAFAQVMARADIALPKHLRNNAGACLAVTMQAHRWDMDAFAVANKTYEVNNRIAYEAQLVAAVVHTRAPIQGRPNYIYLGEGPSRQCKVVCRMSDGEEREYTSPRFDQITTKNSPLWKSDPDQQLGYFSIRSWARRHTPEVILGVYTPDEVETFRNVTPKQAQGTGMKARLESRAAAPTGFDPSHVARETGADDPLEGDDVPRFDKDTGEIIDAEIEETSTEAGTQTDAAPSQEQPPATPPATDELTLDQLIAAYETRLREAPSATKLQSIYAANTKLRVRIDASEPERLVELDDLFNQRFAELAEKEQAERAAEASR